MATASTALGHAHIATIGDGGCEDESIHKSEREAIVATGMDSFTVVVGCPKLSSKQI